MRAVFEAAFDLPADQRPALLDAECGDDRALRAEVEELLAAESVAESLLEPAPDDDALLRQLAAPGLSETSVGGYRLVRLVGSGGMGVVFEAEQDQPRRRVALKMLRLGFSVGDAARFRFEAELLGRLRHRGIAQVYAAGLHEVAGSTVDLPWFAMEFIEGEQSLLEHAAAAELSAEERASLLADVCDALQHAHQHGVLHCDLKPANILVDADGQPKVIDFGVGRVRDAEAPRHTVTGQIIGTLAYMSPEQVAGDRDAIDARSDVYALGAILFELLAGRPPRDLAGVSLTEAVRRLQYGPVPRLSEALGARPDDLDAVVAMAMAPDRERRYASAAQLGDDLRRYLRSEPVAARPPSTVYHMRLFVRRHRLALGAAALVIAVLIAAAIVSTTAALRAERERARGDTLFRGFVDRSMSMTFDYAVRIHALPNAASISADMIRATIADLEELEQSDPSRALRESVTHAYTRLGQIQGLTTSPNLGDPDGARRSFEVALRLARELVAERPNDAAGRWLQARAKGMMGQLELQTGTPEAALVWLEQAGALADEVAAEHPDGDNYSACAAAAHDFTANAFSRLDRLDEAESHRAVALASYEALREKNPGDWRYAHNVMTTRNQAAVDSYRRGQQAEADGEGETAREYYARSRSEVLAVCEAAQERFGSGANARRARLFLVAAATWSGSMSLLLEDLDRAEIDLEQALAIYRELAAEEPDDVRWVKSRADALRSLGNTARSKAQRATDGEEQRRLWLAARAYYAESLEDWQALASGGGLRPSLAGTADDVRARVAACDEALRELDGP